MDRTASRKRTALWILAAIVIVAFVARWPIAHRLLPEVPEPDAFQVLHAQEWRHDPALVKNWEYAQRYPKLLTYAFAAFPTRELDERTSGEERLEEALECAAAPHQRGRIIVLVLSLLALPLTWLVARRFTGENTALIATWLVATSALHALFSTQARPHGVHLTTSLLAVWAALRVVERPTWKRILAAVVCAAAAMGTLQNGVFTLAPLAVAMLFAGGSWPRRIALALMSPILAATLAFSVYPVLPSVDATGFHLGGAGSHNVLFSEFTFGGFAVVARWFAGHDPAFAALTILGLALSVAWFAKHGAALMKGQRPLVAVALAYVVPYALLLFWSQEIYERFLLPLLPWFAIVALRPWRRIVDERAANRLTFVSRAMLFIVLAAPLGVLARFAWVSAQPNTLQQAADWIVHDTTARSSRMVATPTLSLPFFIEPESLERARGDVSFGSRLWFAWQLAHPSATGMKYDVLSARLANDRDDFSALDAWLAERRPEFVVLEVSRKTSQIPALRHLHVWAMEHGEIAYRSVGAAPNRIELGLADYQSIEGFSRRLFGMSAFGPGIEIWRITR